jgi:hypothetical protein
MTPESTQSMEPAPPEMSEFSRVTGVFFEPKKAFTDIAERPRWIVPLILVILANMAFTIAISQRIGWERIIGQQIESNPRTAQLPAAQRAQAVAMGAKIASISSYAGPIVGVPMYSLISAGILLGIVAGLLSVSLKFKQVFAVICYSGLPGVIFSILAIVVIFLKNPDEFNMRNPLAFNPGAFMDPAGGSKFIYSLATSLDLFTIWTVLLIATGLKAAAGRRLSFGGALFAVALPWAILVLGKAALAGSGLLG